eukprot:gb/GECH01001379.1/.p1 GENE.gb/GECH01001379.1/~~gb/GECH01001379.1/.p1  ORF type:complete len:400 (+),score=101.82 gb/GECH01001379.1/:1-1200(+)
MSKRNTLYKFKESITENHYGVIYTIKFNTWSSRFQNCFCTAASNCLNVYLLTEKKRIKLLQSYVDENKEEEFFTCEWGHPNQVKDKEIEDEGPVIAVGGAGQVVKIINCQSGKCLTELIGHGGSIHRLSFHPTDHTLLLSSSKDESVRIWNVSTGQCIAVYGGHEGHRNEILAADFHKSGSVFVTGGMDNSVKIWAMLDTTTMTTDDKAPLRHYPVYVTDDIHQNYVDCVKFLGDTLFSKSMEGNMEAGDSIRMWVPNEPIDAIPLTQQSSSPENKQIQQYNFTILKEFKIRKCDVWYIHFSFDPAKQILAVPRPAGIVELFYIDDKNNNDKNNNGNNSERNEQDSFNSDNQLEKQPFQRLQAPHCRLVLRDVAFSPDSNILIAVGDDATLYVWRIKQK